MTASGTVQEILCLIEYLNFIKLFLYFYRVYDIYIYNSVLTRRHRHSNSSASTPPNATKIAEMKVSQPGMVIVGPELLFSIYKLLWVFF